MTRSSTRLSSRSALGACAPPGLRGPPAPGRPGRAPRAPRWTPGPPPRRSRPAGGPARRSRLRAPTSTPRVGSSSSSTSTALQQPAGQHHLLLVAAGERAHRPAGVGRSHVELRGHLRRPRHSSASRPRKPARANRRSAGSETLRDTGSDSSRPWLLRSSGQRPMRARTADGTEPAPQRPPVHAHRARRRAAGAVHGLQDLRAPRPDQAREADDLAGPHRERDVFELARPREPLDLEHRPPAGVPRPRGGEHVLDGPPGHQPDHLGGGGVAAPAGCGPPCGRP